MKLTHLHREADMADIKALYEKAFPPEEKKPFSLILQKNDAGSMDILSIEEDDGRFLGLAIFILHGDLALLDYFAIAEQERGKGHGTRALALLFKRYPGKRFLLEIEDADEATAANLDERIGRKSFYLRCGMRELDYRIMLFGVRMQILTNGTDVSFEEYHAIFPAVFSERTAKNVRLIEE